MKTCEGDPFSPCSGCPGRAVSTATAKGRTQLGECVREEKAGSVRNARYFGSNNGA